MAGRILRVMLLIMVIAVTFSFLPGCGDKPAVEVKVEDINENQGKNVQPLRNKIISDAKKAINIWINEPENVDKVFTDKMMEEWEAARELDKEEGVKRVRVHEDKEFRIVQLNDGKRPQVNYSFFDKSYFVYAETGKQKTEPYNKERTISLFLVKNNGNYKIDSMIGDTEAIR